MEMIERVAKAIDPMAWSELAVSTWHGDGLVAARKTAMDQARDAIEAMKLPAGASSVPGGLAIEESMFGSEDTVFHGAAKCWNAMIDDVLALPADIREG